MPNTPLVPNQPSVPDWPYWPPYGPIVTYVSTSGYEFYYPDGKPKTPENKVYVESLSLTDYLYESMC